MERTNNGIGKRIKWLRKQQNITQTDVYKACGISSGNLSSIENGKTLPSSTALMQLSAYFHCSTDYILFGDFYRPRNDANPGRPILCQDAEEAKVLTSYRGLPEEDKREIRLLLALKRNRISEGNTNAPDEITGN